MTTPTTAPPAETAAVSAPSPLPALALAAVAAAPVLLAGCALGGKKGGGDDPGDTSPTLSVTALEVRGESDIPGGAVSVNAIAQPASGGVEFHLSGGNAGSEVASDPGRNAAPRGYDFLIHVATASADR